MKNIAKIVVLFCLIACMLLSTVSCNVSITPIETTIDSETTDATTPEGTTPDQTTPEETTPEETTPEVTTPDETETTPEETTPDEPTIPVDPNEGKATYLIKVTDTNGNPLSGVKLQLYYNG